MHNIYQYMEWFVPFGGNGQTGKVSKLKNCDQEPQDQEFKCNDWV